jgi:hypothetical protein
MNHDLSPPPTSLFIGRFPSPTDRRVPSDGSHQLSPKRQHSRSQHRPPPQTPKTQTTHTSTRRKEKPKKSNAKKGDERGKRRGQEGRERGVGRESARASIGDGCRNEGAEEGRGGASRRRRPQEEAGLPLREGRPPVPRRPYRPLPQAGPLLQAHRHRRPRLPRRRPRVPRRRGQWAPPIPYTPLKTRNP